MIHYHNYSTIYILPVQINDSGAAARDGNLQVGHRILEVNNQSLLGCTHVEAVRTLRGIGEKASFLVCRGYQPDQVSICGLGASNFVSIDHAVFILSCFLQ